MIWVIKKGGDTDTNACIAGQLLGAMLGESALLKEGVTKTNADYVLLCKPVIKKGKLSNILCTSRPDAYHPTKLLVMTEELLSLRASVDGCDGERVAKAPRLV